MGSPTPTEIRAAREAAGLSQTAGNQPHTRATNHLWAAYSEGSLHNHPALWCTDDYGDLLCLAWIPGYAP